MAGTGRSAPRAHGDFAGAARQGATLLLGRLRRGEGDEGWGGRLPKTRPGKRESINPRIRGDIIYPRGRCVFATSNGVTGAMSKDKIVKNIIFEVQTVHTSSSNIVVTHSAWLLGWWFPDKKQCHLQLPRAPYNALEDSLTSQGD